MAVFRFNPHIPDMMASLRDASKGLGKDEAAWIEMMNRRDIDLEDYLANLTFDGYNIPAGVAAGDLYDDFLHGIAVPPPPAESGHVWDGPQYSTVAGPSGGLRTTVDYTVHCATTTLYSNGRIRATVILNSTAAAIGIMFRRQNGDNFLYLHMTTRNNAGDPVSDVVLRRFVNGFGATIQTNISSLSIANGQTLDVDINFNGTQVSASINGIVVIDTVTSDFLFEKGVGIRTQGTSFGAHEAAFSSNPSRVLYIWANGTPVALPGSAAALAVVKADVAALTTRASDTEALLHLLPNPAQAQVPGAEWTPTYVPGTFIVPALTQVLYSEMIDVDGLLAIDGILVEVN